MKWCAQVHAINKGMAGMQPKTHLILLFPLNLIEMTKYIFFVKCYLLIFRNQIISFMKVKHHFFILPAFSFLLSQCPLLFNILRMCPHMVIIYIYEFKFLVDFKVEMHYFCDEDFTSYLFLCSYSLSHF